MNNVMYKKQRISALSLTAIYSVYPVLDNSFCIMMSAITLVIKLTASKVIVLILHLLVLIIFALSVTKVAL